MGRGRSRGQVVATMVGQPRAHRKRSCIIEDESQLSALNTPPRPSTAAPGLLGQASKPVPSLASLDYSHCSLSPVSSHKAWLCLTHPALSWVSPV